MTRLTTRNHRKSPKKAPANDRDGELEMTPMIDVTFLLLIFFMCTLNFRTLEGHLSAYLPKDAGVADAHPAEPPTPPLELLVHRALPGAAPGLTYRLEGQRFHDLEALGLRLAALRAEQVPATSAGREVELDAGEGVGYGEVIAVVDLVVGAGFGELRFATPPSF